MKKFIKRIIDRILRKPLLVKPVVSGSAWDLPDGVYQVGVDKAAKGSKLALKPVWRMRCG